MTFIQSHYSNKKRNQFTINQLNCFFLFVSFLYVAKTMLSLKSSLYQFHFKNNIFTTTTKYSPKMKYALKADSFISHFCSDQKEMRIAHEFKVIIYFCLIYLEMVTNHFSTFFFFEEENIHC